MCQTEDAALRMAAENNFRNGYNCAQSVALAFAEELGVGRELVLRLSQPFGGGMSRMREVCGAVSGMLMCLGLLEGSPDASDRNAKNRCYEAGQELAAEFRRRNGSIVCRELLGLVPLGTSERAAEEGTADIHAVQSPESSERTAEYYRKRPCMSLVGDAAEIFSAFCRTRRA